MRALRADVETRETPVVMLIADAAPGQAEALPAGAPRYLTKPVEYGQLLEAVGEIPRSRNQPMSESLLKARILIVDDRAANILLLERILRRAGYTNLQSAQDPRNVLDLFLEFLPDLMLLDLHMPHLDGLAVMKQLAPHIPASDYMPILVLTAGVPQAARQKALSMGAKDFLTTPVDAVEVLPRIRNLLEARFLHFELQARNRTLDAKVGERTRELELAQYEMIERLARASESRDDDTGQHTQRVGKLAAALAGAAGYSSEQCSLIRRVAALHDVGKIGIPDRILLKPEKLSPEEFDRIKTHTTIGARILSGSRFPLIQLACEIALKHHEKWDGTGYLGLSREEIPLSARIVTIADVYDVLTHSVLTKRLGRPPRPWLKSNSRAAAPSIPGWWRFFETTSGNRISQT